MLGVFRSTSSAEHMLWLFVVLQASCYQEARTKRYDHGKAVRLATAALSACHMLPCMPTAPNTCSAMDGNPGTTHWCGDACISQVV
jgi:hypothetical protein